MEEQLKELLSMTIPGLQAGVEWGKQVVPPTIEQLLTWHFWSSLVIGLAIVEFVVTISCLLLRETMAYSKLTREQQRDHWVDGDAIVVHWIVLCLVGGGLSVVATLELLEALKIYIAPNVWLIEYAAARL